MMSGLVCLFTTQDKGDVDNVAAESWPLALFDEETGLFDKLPGRSDHLFLFSATLSCRLFHSGLFFFSDPEHALSLDF